MGSTEDWERERESKRANFCGQINGTLSNNANEPRVRLQIHGWTDCAENRSAAHPFLLSLGVVCQPLTNGRYINFKRERIICESLFKSTDMWTAVFKNKIIDYQN